MISVYPRGSAANSLIVAEENERSDFDVAVERPLYLFINGGYYAAALLSPRLEREFVTGHLFTEGIIRSISDILSIEFEGNTAEVSLKVKMPVSPARAILSGCGGSAAKTLRGVLPQVESPVCISRRHIITAMRETLSSDSYRRTRGVHKCCLADKQAVIYCAEDIGRHTALDKVIGVGKLKDIDLSRTFVTITGRISSEMVLKCARVGVPVIATKTSVTSYAIDLAELTRVTVAGFAAGARMKVYSMPFRIGDDQ